MLIDQINKYNNYLSTIIYKNYCKGLFECPIILFSFIIIQHLHLSLIQTKGLS
jgi:hypothetical protein